MRDANTLAADRSLDGATVSAAAWPRADWWKTFGDARLDALMDEALADSPTLNIAAARTRKALAAANVSHASLFPRINGGGSSTRALLPESFAALGGGNWATFNQVQATLSWDLDLWGKNRAAYESAVGAARAARDRRPGREAHPFHRHRAGVRGAAARLPAARRGAGDPRGSRADPGAHARAPRRRPRLQRGGQAGGIVAARHARADRPAARAHRARPQPDRRADGRGTRPRARDRAARRRGARTGEASVRAFPRSFSAAVPTWSPSAGGSRRQARTSLRRRRSSIRT